MERPAPSMILSGALVRLERAGAALILELGALPLADALDAWLRTLRHEQRDRAAASAADPARPGG